MIRRPKAPPPGYTLLEVVLACGIAGVLLLAIYQAMMLHYAQLQTGRELAEHAQLVRGLAQQLSRDLRNTFTQWQPADNAVQEDGATTAETTKVVSEYDTPPGGVRGLEDSFTLIVRVPPADLDFSADLGSLDGYTPVSDVRMVRYWLASETSNNGTGLVGLVREEYSRLPDEETTTDPAAAAKVEVLAAEVRSFEIQYYDGSDWQSTWDTDRESAPLAVEVVIGILTPGAARRGETDNSSATEELKYYRLVIALADVQVAELETEEP